MTVAQSPVVWAALFLVLVAVDRKRGGANDAIWALFEPRKPLGEKARRAGWQGFSYRLDRLNGGIVRLAQCRSARASPERAALISGLVQSRTKQLMTQARTKSRVIAEL